MSWLQGQVAVCCCFTVTNTDACRLGRSQAAGASFLITVHVRQLEVERGGGGGRRSGIVLRPPGFLYSLYSDKDLWELLYSTFLGINIYIAAESLLSQDGLTFWTGLGAIWITVLAFLFSIKPSVYWQWWPFSRVSSQLSSSISTICVTGSDFCWPVACVFYIHDFLYFITFTVHHGLPCCGPQTRVWELLPFRLETYACLDRMLGLSICGVHVWTYLG